MTHELKCRPSDFDAITRGRLFLTRPQEEHLVPGRTVRLREFDTPTSRYTGKDTHVVITHIDTASIGLVPGYMTIGVRVVDGKGEG